MDEMRFHDRRDAGRRLGEALVTAGQPRDPVVLALPRGGLPVGLEVARALGSPLEVFVARKLGAPGNPELGIGAIAEGGAVVRNDTIVDALGITDQEVSAIADRERAELERRVRAYRGDRALPELGGRDVVLVDDGLATGITALAAVRALRRHEPRRIVVAAPVCAGETAEVLRREADVVCVHELSPLYAVGLAYKDFRQVTDEEVLRLLAEGRSPP